jgi:hypothetical protein
MKVKELHDDAKLVGLKVKTPAGQVGFIHSLWATQVWLVRDRSKPSKVFYIPIKSQDDVLEWEITDEKPNLK